MFWSKDISSKFEFNLRDTMTISEPFGTTPFPIITSESRIPVRVTFDPSECLHTVNGNSDVVTPQQPQAQQIAVYEASPNEESINGASIIAVNQHFVCYTVKNGLIRILHRHSTLRTLLRSHAGQRVTDIQFFQDGSVLATAACPDDKAGNKSSVNNKSSIVVWRIFERSPEIMSEKLLEIETDKFTISRVLWHPFNPNQFWMVHRDRSNDNVATLVETTKIASTQHPTEQHALCSFYQDFCVMKDAIQLKPSAMSSSTSRTNLTDLCWNGRDTRHVLAVYDSGQIILWDLKGKNTVTSVEGMVIPSAIGEVRDDSDGGLCRCLFLPHEDAVTFRDQDGVTRISSSAPMLTTCFVTASQQNSSLTLWSPWTSDGKLPARLQSISIAGLRSPPATRDSSYLLDVCFGPAPADASPPSCFLVAADREVGRLFAFHCRAVWSDTSSTDAVPKKALLAGCDYVVPFATKHPTYSWNIVCCPTQDISEEELSEQGGLIFDMKLFSYQSSVIQCLTLTSYMCLPPSSTWTDPTPGVLVEPLVATKNGGASTAIVPDLESDVDDVLYDEDYEIEDEEEVDDDEFESAPEASALPPPDVLPGGESTNSETDLRGLAQNPFANWLGAIAAKPIGVPPPPLPAHAAQGVDSYNPVVQPPLPSQPLESFLSPMDILSGKAVPPVTTVEGSVSKVRQEILTSRDPTPTATNKQQNEQKRRQGQRLTANQTVEGSIPRGDVSIRDTAVNNYDSLDESIVRRIIREEMQETIIPSVRQTVQDSWKRVEASDNGNYQERLALSIAPLQQSIESISKQGLTIDKDAIANTVSEAVNESIRAAFADTIRSVLIPSIESITGQVFAKVSEHLETSEKAHQQNTSATSKEIESMSKQLSTMTQLVAKLTDEVQTLRRDVAMAASQQPVPIAGGASVSSAPQPKPSPPVDPIQTKRNEILVLLRERNYESAFTTAVSASTADMVVFCCRNADLNEVLGGSKPVLSQPILLCLMQQLGTVLVAAQNSNLQIEMDWLQEIALCLNPADASIHRHVPAVIQLVVNSINQRLKLIHGTDQNQLRRQLQKMLQLMRGMSIGSRSS